MSLYRRLLRASKIIDNTNSAIAYQSILCGKPTSLYSYELRRNIEIGTASYSSYDKFLSIMNDGEYSSPIHANCISLSSVIRNTTRLCSKKKSSKQSKFSLFSNYFEDIVLSKDDLMEIVINLESLANIALTQKMASNTQHNALDESTTQNTLECDVIDWNHQCTDSDLQSAIVNVLKNQQIKSDVDEKLFKQKVKKKKKSQIVLEYAPKTLQTSGDVCSLWKNCILIQHPLAAMSKYGNYSEFKLSEPDKIEPNVLLGLYSQTNSSKFRLSGSYCSAFLLFYSFF